MTIPILTVLDSAAGLPCAAAGFFEFLVIIIKQCRFCGLCAQASSHSPLLVLRLAPGVLRSSVRVSSDLAHV